jgi:hypothetical protein
MNRTTLTLTLVAALCAGTAYAQNSATTVAQPTSPAPRVATPNQPSAANQTPAVVQVPNAPTPTSAAQTVYTPKLPTPEDLTSAAAAQGYTIERLVQTGTQVIAFYRTPNGQSTTVAYQSLPPAGPAPAANPAPAPARVVVTAPPPVVYETVPRVVYYDDYYPSYYYPRVWYPPVSLSFGFGYHSFRGGYHGGYHHW